MQLVPVVSPNVTLRPSRFNYDITDERHRPVAFPSSVSRQASSRTPIFSQYAMSRELFRHFHELVLEARLNFVNSFSWELLRHLRDGGVFCVIDLFPLPS